MTIHSHGPSATSALDAASTAAVIGARFDPPAHQDRGVGDRKATAASGLAATVFGVASFALLGNLPDTNDGGERLTRYITDHRSALLVGACHLGALASVANSGALAPAGAFTYAAPAAYTLWILAFSLAILRSPAPPRAAR